MFVVLGQRAPATARMHAHAQALWLFQHSRARHAEMVVHAAVGRTTPIVPKHQGCGDVWLVPMFMIQPENSPAPDFFARYVHTRRAERLDREALKRRQGLGGKTEDGGNELIAQLEGLALASTRASLSARRSTSTLLSSCPLRIYERWASLLSAHGRSS